MAGDRDRDRSRSRSRSRDRRDKDRDRDKEKDKKKEKEKEKDKDKRDRSRDRDRSRKEDKADPPEDDVFKVGRTVVVKGLKNNAEKNGSIGKLVEFKQDKGRWSVELTGGTHNFKEENLELMPDNSDIVDEHEAPPTAKIYITGLSRDTTEKDLIALFKGCGMIAKEKPKARNPKDAGFPDQWPFAVKLYKPGRNDGDACIEYMDAFAAKAAIKTYNRYKLQGSKIGVQYAGHGRKYEAVELRLPWHLREENQGKLDRDSGGGSTSKPEDWTCPECFVNNFASRDTCFKCATAKPGGVSATSGGGKDQGGGGAGALKTWTCTDCGSVVLSFKSHCYKCGGAKPRGGPGGAR